MRLSLTQPAIILSLSLCAALAAPARAEEAKAAPAAGKAAAAGKTQLTWYGHAAFKLVTPAGKVVFIDPWVQNPANKNGAADLAAIDKADLILVSHGHSDHVGDAIAIAKKTGAQLVTTFDLGRSLVGVGYPQAQFGLPTTGNFGGEIELLDGEVKVAFIPAVHSSAVAAGETEFRQGGNPGGFLVTVKGGPAVYHTGDTDVFGEMAFIKQFHPVDVMLACIGGKFTMDPKRAAEAVRLAGAAKVVPMHFGTFPVLTGTPEAFEKALKANGAKAKLVRMEIGQTISL